MFFSMPINVRFSTPYIGIPILRIRVETLSNPFAKTVLLNYFLKFYNMAKEYFGEVMEIEPSKDYEINDGSSVAFFSIIFKSDGDMENFIGNF